MTCRLVPAPITSPTPGRSRGSCMTGKDLSSAVCGIPKPLSSPSKAAEMSVSATSSDGDAVTSAGRWRTDFQRGRGDTLVRFVGWCVNSELLAGYARTLEVLRARGVLRTANAPLGDFAEWLVWRAFGGTIEPNSTKSHDVTDAVGRKLQVKGASCLSESDARSATDVGVPVVGASTSPCWFNSPSGLLGCAGLDASG